MSSHTSQQGNTPSSLPMLPGFSEEQVNSIINLFQNMLQTTLQQFFPQNSTPLPSSEPSEPSFSKSSPSHTNPVPLRAEEVGYFDPEYQQEQRMSNGPVINASKYVYYRDVYIFVDRLKDLATQHDIKHIISTCFRGSALM